MPKRPKRRRRSVASYRAASLKGARTRLMMKQARNLSDGLVAARDRLLWGSIGATLDDMLPPEKTINRIPKVEWP